MTRFLESRFAQQHNLNIVISNTGWLFVDKIIRMGVGLIVSIRIASYLGPEQFGLWSYAIAFASLFSLFATLGLDNIVIRNLVKTPQNTDVLLGTAFGLKVIGGVLTFILSLLVISYLRTGESIILLLVGISAAGYFFQAINVVDLYFQSKVMSKYSVFAFSGAFFMVTIIKILLLILEAPLVTFALAGLVEIILAAILLLYAYYINQKNILRWRFQCSIARELLKDSLPIIISGLTILLYMRIDQVMIGKMLGDRELGLYSAAVRISETCYVIPTIITSSLFPIIVALKGQCLDDYNKRLQKLYDLMFLLALIIALPMTIWSDKIVIFLFGNSFAGSGPSLAILIWSGVFVFLSCVWSSDVVAGNGQKIFIKFDLCSISINIILNILLIPRIGIVGAAIATALSVPITYIIIYALFKEYRNSINCIVRSLLMVNMINKLRNLV